MSAVGRASTTSTTEANTTANICFYEGAGTSEIAKIYYRQGAEGRIALKHGLYITTSTPTVAAILSNTPEGGLYATGYIKSNAGLVSQNILTNTDESSYGTFIKNAILTSRKKANSDLVSKLRGNTLSFFSTGGLPSANLGLQPYSRIDFYSADNMSLYPDESSAMQTAASIYHYYNNSSIGIDGGLYVGDGFTYSTNLEKGTLKTTGSITSEYSNDKSISLEPNYTETFTLLGKEYTSYYGLLGMKHPNNTMISMAGSSYAATIIHSGNNKYFIFNSGIQMGYPNTLAQLYLGLYPQGSISTDKYVCADTMVANNIALSTETGGGTLMIGTDENDTLAIMNQSGIMFNRPTLKDSSDYWTASGIIFNTYSTAGAELTSMLCQYTGNRFLSVFGGLYVTRDDFSDSTAMPTSITQCSLYVKGNIRTTGTLTQNVSNDYAENLPKNEEHIAEEGDIICCYPETNTYGKATPESANLVVGVYSTDYAMIVGKIDEDKSEEDDYIPVGMCGIVPVKIEGEIKAGDLITLSPNNAGVGIAVPNDKRAEYIGKIVGKALENKDTTEISKIKMQIMLA